MHDLLLRVTSIVDINELKQGFRLGDFEVQPLQGQVIGESDAVRVQPRAMDVLMVLARNGGEVVERSVIIDEVWGGRAQSDEPLNRCITLLRRAFGDSRADPSIIDTIHKRGYRLIPPVTPLHPVKPGVTRSGDSKKPEQARPRRGARNSVSVAQASLAVAVLSLAIVLLVVIRQQGFHSIFAPRDADVASVAVLPFSELGDTGEEAFLGDGLSESIISRLASVPGLEVAARTSSFSFKGSNEDARKITSQLGVSYLINGSIRRIGSEFRILAELVDVGGKVVWSDSYEGMLQTGEIFTTQDAIANDIVAQIRPALPVADASRLIKTDPPTENIDAYELVLRGQFFLQRRDEAPLRKSIALFQEAIALDRSYGDAYVGMATAYALLPFYSYETVASSFDDAMTIIERGAGLDSTVDEKATGIMAFMLFYGEWRWIESEISFRRAIDRSPHDSELLQWYSHFMGGVGRTREAHDSAMLAKTLDRLSPVVNQRLAITYLWMDETELALKQFEFAHELGMPPTTHPEAYLILLLRNGEYDKVRSLMVGMQRALRYEIDWVDSVIAAIKNPASRPAAVDAVVRAEQNGQVSMRYLFGVWMYLGETGRAIDAALHLIEDRPSFNTEILFVDEARELRRDPRFAELVRAIGLHRYWDKFGWPDACARKGGEIACT